MSNIGGEGGSFSSGINTGEDEVHLFDVPAAAGANSNVSTSRQPPPAVKKKRNLPGNPDPTAEVIALSPGTLMATNRFMCEICHKGFQRDQNLQLHRRGHNLPWKLRQRASSEIRKKVYVCPIPTCVHHSPSRALGDLTGIKKHYSRKHGEKKWKCDRCSKKYAVQSDWKAHSKVCGTREYKCDCGTIFSRRDSFITHRAFCDALAQENKQLNQPLMATIASSLHSQGPNPVMPDVAGAASTALFDFRHGDMKSPPLKTFSGNLPAASLRPPGMAETLYSPRSIPSSLHLGGSGPMGFDGLGEVNVGRLMAGPAHVSATALLQKAAQMGATSSGSSTSSPMMQRGFASIMAGPDWASSTRPYGPMKAHEPFHIEQSELVGINGGGITDQFYDPPINHKGMFMTARTSMSSGDGLLKYDGHGGGGGPGGVEVMTVDFLGVGGHRSLDEQQQQQETMEYGGVGQGRKMEGLHPFQEPMWNV